MLEIMIVSEKVGFGHEVSDWGSVYNVQECPGIYPRTSVSPGLDGTNGSGAEYVAVRCSRTRIRAHARSHTLPHAYCR